MITSVSVMPNILRRIWGTSLFLALTAFPLLGGEAVTGPTFGPTFSYISGPDFPLGHFVSGPVVASNGESFLTLWSASGSELDVYGSLAGAGGDVLTPNAFVVIPHASVENVFPYGAGYLAIIAEEGLHGQTRAAILDRNGKFVRYAASLIPYYSWFRARAFNGSEIFSIRLPLGGNPDVLGQITTLEGKMIRDNIPLSTTTLDAVTNIGTDFVVASAEQDGIYAQRFSADGSQVTARVRVADTTRQLTSFSIASSGNDAAIAWADMDSAYSFGGTIHVAVVTSTSVFVAANMPQPNVFAAHVVWSGHDYLVVTNRTVIARIAHDATITPFVAPAGVAEAVDGSVLYSVDVSGPSPGKQVTGTATSLDGSPITSAVVLSTTLRQQGSPTLATDGVNYLATWSDQSGDGSRHAAIRVARDGTHLDESQIDLGSGSSPAGSVIFGRTIYLTAWQQERNVVARRLDRSGNPLDAQPVLLATDATISDQAIAFNGNSFVVLWSTAKAIAGVLVSESGEISPLSFPSFPGKAFDLSDPVIVWDGAQFIVASRYPTPPCNDWCIEITSTWVARLNAAGFPLDSAPTDVNWSASREAPMHLAADGRGGVVTGLSNIAYLRPLAPYAIEAVRVDATGNTPSFASPVEVFRWVSSMTSNILWDGRDFVIAWRYRDPLRQERLGAARLSANLAALSAGYIEVGAGIGDSPAMASRSSGEILFAISEATDPGGIARLHTHSEAELRPMPPVPPTPMITKATGTPLLITLEWNVPPGSVDGFLFESRGSLIGFWSGFASGTSRRIDLPGLGLGHFLDLVVDEVRMRAFNAAGFSAPTPDVRLLPPPRSRAASH